MATIDAWDMVQTLINNDGYYFDDPRVVKVVEYTNGFGNRAWGIVYPRDDPDRYHESEYVRNPKTIWEAK